MTQLTIKQNRNNYLVHRHASPSEALESMFDGLCNDKKLYARWDALAQGDDFQRDALEQAWNSDHVQYVYNENWRHNRYAHYKILRPRQLVELAVEALEEAIAESESQNQ